MSHTKNPYTQRIIILTLVVGLVTVLTNLMAVRQQYRMALKDKKASLVALTYGCGEFLESAVHQAGREIAGPGVGHSGSWQEIVLRNPHFLEYAKRGEFLLAATEGEGFRMLLLSPTMPQRLVDNLHAWASPASRALAGQSGEMTLGDGRGNTWIATYRPVAGSRWALIGRIDQAEVLEPFLITGAMVSVITLLAVLLGGFLFRRMVDPMLADLADREERYRKVAEVSEAGISIHDLDSVVTFVNPAMERMLGYPPGGLIGVHLSQVASPRQATEFAQNTRNRIHGDGPSRYEATLLHRDGREIPVMISAAALMDEQGRFQGTLAVAVDISDQKRTEAELTRLKDVAEVASEAKSEFLANITHELRSPLHVILGFAQQGLKRGDQAERGRLINYFSRIHGSGTLLLDTVNELLDLSKLDAGRMQFEFGPTRLNSLVSSVVDECISLFSSRGINVEFREPDEPINTEADQDRLKQVLRNLLSNAAKFSNPDSTVVVILDRHEEGARVQVRDSGPGIPHQELDLIFQKFIQSSRTKSGAGGTGLGLAICREIITAHEGQMFASNAEGGGAVFTFTLPLRREAPLDSPADLAIAPGAV